MPAIVGMVKVNILSSSSVFNIGDVYRAAPYAEAKTFSGSGSFNTGPEVTTFNHYNTTNTNDMDTYDQLISSVL
ncbi:spore germination protein [Terrilactibacillus sp. S3-3]|nr:spore germination protein [Terrilactibacillus sp. S3-3]